MPPSCLQNRIIMYRRSRGPITYCISRLLLELFSTSRIMVFATEYRPTILLTLSIITGFRMRLYAFNNLYTSSVCGACSCLYIRGPCLRLRPCSSSILFRMPSLVAENATFRVSAMVWRNLYRQESLWLNLMRLAAFALQTRVERWSRDVRPRLRPICSR